MRSIQMSKGSEALGADFGRYLEAVAERDIDLLLMEEFHISDDFVAWFCGEVGLTGISSAGAWHSLCDTNGQSDLLLRVLKEGRRIGVLIENKVAAPEQDLQGERYDLRGIRLRDQGKLDDYVTVMCAPTNYLDALGNDSDFFFVSRSRDTFQKIASRMLWLARFIKARLVDPNFGPADCLQHLAPIGLGKAQH
jgi:hypothetical protein